MLHGLGPRREILDRVGRAAAVRGWRVALVGGAIVDLVAGRPAKDLDLVVEGDAPTLAADLAASHGGSVLAHQAFRTATWTTADGEPVDLVMARTEHYRAPAALPAVSPGTLEQDLDRRDFTVLSVAVDLADGRVLDPSGGLSDLQGRLLRIKHPRSFHDDPTRAWRAARWSVRLGLALSPETRAALDDAVRDGMPRVVGLERSGNELLRVFREEHPWLALRGLTTWGWLQAVHPGFSERSCKAIHRAAVSSGPAQEHTSGEPVPREPLLWLALARSLDRPDRKALARMVTPGGDALQLWLEGPERVARGIAAAAAWPDRVALARGVMDLSPEERAEVWRETEDVRQASRWWEQQGRHIRSSVTAADLIAAGYAPGPAIGQALRAAQDAAWRGEDDTGQRRAAGLPPP